MMKGFNKWAIVKGLLISVSVFFISCAQVVSPNGGERDVSPPKLQKSVPINGATNFKGNKLQLQFDEYITLKDINNQLLISPPLKEIPDAQVKNKNLLLEFKDSLKPNTTYTFSFGNSIVDFTESNALENFQFVFSTGPLIDSLSLSGQVTRAFNLAPEKGIYVLLYDIKKTEKDSFPYYELPDYFGKTNEFGSYRINHVRAGEYKVFALKDGNSNYLFDSDDELIGFLDTTLFISQNTETNLTVFQEEKSKLYVKKPAKAYDGLVICAFSRPVENPVLVPLETTQTFVWSANEVSANKDSIRFWYAGASGDSLKLKVLVSGLVIDTLAFALTKNQGETGGRDKKRLLINSSVSPLSTHDLNKNLTLVLSQPVKTINLSKIRLKSRGDTLAYSWVATDSIRKKFELRYKFLEDSTYKAVFFTGEL